MPDAHITNISSRHAPFVQNLAENELPQIPKPADANQRDQSGRSWVPHEEAHENQQGLTHATTSMRDMAEQGTSNQQQRIAPQSSTMMSRETMMGEGARRPSESGRQQPDTKQLNTPSSDEMSTKDTSLPQAKVQKTAEGTTPSTSQANQQRFENRDIVAAKADKTSSDTITTGGMAPEIPPNQTPPLTCDTSHKQKKDIESITTEGGDVGSPRHV
jgi:hypothetical protein